MRATLFRDPSGKKKRLIERPRLLLSLARVSTRTVPRTTLETWASLRGARVVAGRTEIP
jgi:hypothetical protein